MPNKAPFYRRNQRIAKSLPEISQVMKSLATANYQLELSPKTADKLAFKISGFAGTDYCMEGTIQELGDKASEISYISTVNYLDISPKLRRYIPMMVFLVWLLYFVTTLGFNYNNGNLPERCIYTSASGRSSIIHNPDCDEIIISNAHAESLLYWSWLIPLLVYLVMSRFDFYPRQNRAARQASKELETQFLAAIAG